MTHTPTNMHEYHQRFAQNELTHGRGMDTGVTIPCPFCACADFMTYKVIDVKRVIGEGAVCKECRRGARAIFSVGPGTTFEIVQTSGPDQPAWLTPKMRREEDLHAG